MNSERNMWEEGDVSSGAVADEIDCNLPSKTASSPS